MGIGRIGPVVSAVVGAEPRAGPELPGRATVAAMNPADISGRLADIERATAIRLGLDISTAPTPARAFREFLGACERVEPTIEAKISVQDPALHAVFHALCGRYGVPAYRKPRQRWSTITMSGPSTFLHKVIEPMFQEMSVVLGKWFLGQTTVILGEFEATGDRIVMPQIDELEP